MPDPVETPEPKTRRRWLRRLVRIVGVGAGISLVLGAVAAGIGAWMYQEHVVRNPGPHLERDHILGIIAQESPVYYRDGTTRIGVFFEDEHREYVAWEELPPPYVAAIIASEDGTFWRHQGVSPKHIIRAFRDNFEAGRTVSGGSTLTQQTAKNLYYRPDRSWRSKWNELVNALRLEAHYDKSEILTFYVNQFHVSGNGRGLGIAARYFFDKDVSELSLVENAYLAGLVKAPGRYDPFLGDADRQARARERALARTRYVLQRIVDEPAENMVGPWPVSADNPDAARLVQIERWKIEARRLLDEGFELPFRRGQFRYDSNAVLDEVRRRLAEPPFDQVLSESGIEDPDKAGLVVITTLDPDAQREGIYSLWHHLTEVGSWMETLTAEDFLRKDSRGPRYDPFHEPRAHEFRLATVTGHPSSDGRIVLDLDLGGHRCRVDRDGLVRVALATHRGAQKNRFAKVPGAKVDAFANTLVDGSTVWVSVREVSANGSALCDLEVRPELQGSVVAMQDGQLRVMVGGNDNRNFNRATALRQFGSTWKPLVYHAALELGWRPDDPLDNRRNVFPFSTTFYYPRPDHTPQPVVSMAWAGVNSENLASIWLLYHLTDKLNGEQVRVLAEALDLARRPDENAKAYRTRIQTAGVLPTRARVREALFLKARQDTLGGLGLSGHPEDELSLSSLLYGWGHDGELRKVTLRGGSERARRERALGNSWRHLSSRLAPCKGQYDALERAVTSGRTPDPMLVPDLSVLMTEADIRVACGGLPAGYVPPDAEALATILTPTVGPAGPTGLDRGDPGAPVVPGRKPARRRGLGERLGDLFGLGGGPDDEIEPAGPVLRPWKDVLVEERLHVETLTAVGDALSRRELLQDAAGDTDLYAPELLYWHQDFRVLLSLRYVAELGHQYGIRSEVRPVLSLPLGASEITLEEAVTAYGGAVTGQAWSYPGRAFQPGALVSGVEVPSPPSPALLVAEIRDVDGRVIYQAHPESREVAKPATAAMTADILRNVVQHGTGRRAEYAVLLDGGAVPLGGKTGTTNDFKNAAFLGFAPTFQDGAWTPDGYVVGAYVGYDDNRPMTNGRIRLAGSSGALPAWIGTVRGLADAGLLGEPGAPPDGGWQLTDTPGLVRVEVDGTQGLPVGEPPPVASPDPGDEPDPADAKDAEYEVLVPAGAPRAKAVEILFQEVPRPIRVAPSTTEAAERERRRRELLEALRDRPSIWDDL